MVSNFEQNSVLQDNNKKAKQSESIGVLQALKIFKLDKKPVWSGIITNNSSLGPKGPSDELFCNNALQTDFYPLHNLEKLDQTNLSMLQNHQHFL